MKKIVLLFVSFTLLLVASCDKKEVTSVAIKHAPPIATDNIVKLPSKSLLWDEIYEIRDGKEIDITDSQFRTRGITGHEFYEITTLVPRWIFAGSVLSAASVTSGKYKQIGYANAWKDKVTVSFSLPVRSKEIKISKSATVDAVVEAVGDRDFSGRQSQVFSYKMKEFSFYSELKLAFGANVNVGNIFSIGADVEHAKIKSKSALFVEFSQTYFSIDMDTPDDGNIFKNEDIRLRYLGQNPVYVASVNYGRKGIIMVESEQDYKATSAAIRAAFTAKIVNGELSMEGKHKELLERAETQICIIGGDGNDAVKTVKGFQEFQNYIINGGVYTKDVYGVPISFGAAYAEDNSLFVTEFEVEHD